MTEFPNRAWPWRVENDRDAEALAERARRPEPPHKVEGGRKVYLAPKVRKQKPSLRQVKRTEAVRGRIAF